MSNFSPSRRILIPDLRQADFLAAFRDPGILKRYTFWESSQHPDVWKADVFLQPDPNPYVIFTRYSTHIGQGILWKSPRISFQQFTHESLPFAQISDPNTFESIVLYFEHQEARTWPTT